MRLGIIGLPSSGKTTIFNALTGSNRPTGAGSGGFMEIHSEVVSVPDERVDKLSAMYKPKKTIYATITFSDIAGVDKGFGESGLSGPLKNELAKVDGFIHVVRSFEADTVPHPYGTLDPVRDVDIIDNEFLLSDLIAIERRIERLQDDYKKAKKEDKNRVGAEIELMQRLREPMESEVPIRDIDLSPEEEKTIRGFGFFTQKPVLIVINCGDEIRPAEAIMKYDHKHSHVISLQGRIEAEIAQLSPEDAEVFRAEYGITEPVAKRVISEAYRLLKLHSFLTVGEDEVRAWSIPVGATAQQAAAAVHTDLAQHFIRAEVMTYQDLIALGSEHAVKEAGKMRLEGKHYIVQDGDIVHIRAGK